MLILHHVCPSFFILFVTGIHNITTAHKSPGSVLDAVQPTNIHFDAYTSVELIKSVRSS